MEDVQPPPPEPFLDYYHLGLLGERNVAGPYLKLVSYDPASGSYRASVLVACTSDRQAARAPDGQPQLTWRETGADGQDAGGEQQAVAGELLSSWRHWNFWRFSISTTCGSAPKKLIYQVPLASSSRSYTVALPSVHEDWSWAFYSCNGLDKPENKQSTRGMEPMWRDVVERHAQRPFHALVGGGDQLYNDAVFSGPNLAGWDQTLKSTDTREKASLPFTQAMQDEVEDFYFSHYVIHFSQPLYCDALATIPSLNTWDDHDIVDGWGSYPDLVQGSAVMRGLFAAAQRFYLLFQQHTTPERMAADGFWAGSSCMACLGPHTAVVLPDGRTYRLLHQVHAPDFNEQLEARLRQLPPTIKHVVMVLAVPILYPKLDVNEAMKVASDAITGSKRINHFLQKTGVLRLLPMRFGMVELIDDLTDHWDYKEHEHERDALLHLLMRLSGERGFRVSCLSGDVHCGGYGVFHQRRDDSPDLPMPDPAALAASPKFIPQIISSAIVNVPPPIFVLKALQLAGWKPKTVLEDCVWRMVRLKGTHDEDKGDLLLGNRNWCEVTGGAADLSYSLRTERELGSGQIQVYDIQVPALST